MMDKIDYRQREQWTACNAIQQKEYRAAILAGTGFGKTRVVVTSIIMWHPGGEEKVLILVPFEHLKARFKDEFIKVLGEDLGAIFVKDHVEMHCYASVKKLNANDYDFVAGDEIHLGLTDKCMAFYEKVTGPLVLCTATMPEDAEYRKRLINLVPLAYKISIDKCVELDIVAPYSIECVGLSLTTTEQGMYNQVNKNFGYWKSKLGMDAFNMANTILGSKKNSLSHRYTNEDFAAATGFFRAIRQRKGLVDHASNKIAAAKAFSQIVSAYDGRMLVFGGDNAFTDTIAESIDGSVVFHSKKSTKQRNLALNQFRNGESHVLCSTKALNQGLDVPDASIGLICGLTSKALTMIQRVGRLVRIDSNDPSKAGRVVVLYVKESQEEKWLRNALRKTDPKNISWIELEEILESTSSEQPAPLIKEV